ncbi:alpha-tocopherol transfer protein-like [Vanessa atalanta]|uniref:alpha-tocopherol transfer protein-like n=1 Tax=Vanessa atalanta TaxID=42275 RepID=UPI001FCDBFF7|nr:alpha-tocopherol transfer protein-like [Vanessa atalanta]
MPQDSTQDVLAIREWMSKESHLPNNLDDEIIKKFLHSCYWSLEKTKKCLDRFFIGRSTMNEIYSSRDPLSPKLQAMFSVTVVASYEFEKDEIMIHKYDDPTVEQFNFYDILKTLTMEADQWIKKQQFMAEGHYIIVDMSCYSLKMIPKINIMFFRDFLLFLLEGMPVRLKKVFAINAPSFYDKMYALIKPALPAEICDVIYFFSDYQSLYKFIDKKYLPSEYGGEAQSMYEQNKMWLRYIEDDRLFYLNENIWKADMTKKLKNSNADVTMNGSFRKLSID